MSPDALANRGRGAAGPVVALLLVQLFFGVFSVIGKIALREVTPFVLTAFRAVFGALLLTALSRLLAPHEPPMTARDRFKIFQLGLAGVVGNQLLFVSGLTRTTATNATLLGVTIPVFTLVLALGMGVERPGLRRVLGIPVALAGVLLILLPRGSRLGGTHLAGDLMIVGNCLVYSVYLVASREILRRRSAIAVVAGAFRWAAVPVILVAVPDLLRFRPAALTPTAWWAIAGVILLSTVGAYALNAWALARTGPSTAAAFIYVQPLVAALLAAAVLGERPGPRTFAAAALIFAGLGLATLGGRPRPLALPRPLQTAETPRYSSLTRGSRASSREGPERTTRPDSRT